MSMNLRGNWNYPTTIWAGPGRIDELAKACAMANIRRPLIVTDEGLAGAPMISSAVAALRDAALFGGVRGNPASSHVEAGLRAYRAGRHDGVVAFGGGSALDGGKVVAFMSGQTRPLWDFEDVGDWWTRADPAGIAPVVAVPTTAGTGSEVGRAGVILNEETHQKKIIFHPLMMPRVVIADPELTVGLPAHRDRRHGHGCLRPLLRGFLRAGLPSARRRRRARGHAAHPALPAARLRGRP